MVAANNFGDFRNNHIFQQVFDKSSEAIRIISTEYKILNANNLYSKLSKTKLEELIGKNCDNYFCSNYCGTENCSVRLVLKKGKIENKRLLQSLDGNEKRWYIFNALPLFDEKNNTIGIFESYRDINEIVEQESTISKNEKRLQHVINCIADWVWEIDENNKYTFSSKHSYDILGYKSEEILGKTPFDFMLLEESEQIRKNFQKIRDKKEPIKNLENWNITKEGRIVCLLTNGSPIFDDSGNYKGFRGIDRDITESKLEVNRLKENDERLTALFQGSSLGLVLGTPEGNLTYINPAFAKMLEYKEEELISLSYKDFTFNDDLEKEELLLNQLHEGKIKSYYIEKRYVKKSGKIFWIRINVSAYKEKGKIKSLIGIIEDIDASKKAEIELEKQTSLLNQVLETAPAAMRFVKNGEIIMANEKYAELNKIDTKRVIGKKCGDFLCSNDCKNQCGYDLLKDGADDLKGNLTLNEHTDNPTFLEYKVKVVKNKENECVGMLQFFWDITEIKKAQQQIYNYQNHLEELISQRTNELILSEKKFKNIFNSGMDAIMITDLEGNFLEVNDRAISRTGISKDEFLLLNADHFYENKQKEIEKYKETLLSKGEANIETNYASRDGNRYFIEIKSKIIQYNKQDAVLHVSRDISERKNMERKIRSAIFETEERERNRFAKELHDGLGALLSGIKLQLSLLNKKDLPLATKDEIIKRSTNLLSEASKTTREIANDIRPHILNDFGLVQTIKDFCEQINITGKMNISFDAKNLDQSLLNEEIETNLFRIINETINNGIKHSEATKIELRLFSENNRIIYIYSDDGIGFFPEKLNEKTGMGINNIITRTKSLNGLYNINTIPGNGVDILIEVDANTNSI